MNLNLILFVLVLILACGAVARTRRLRSCEGFIVLLLALGFFAFPLMVGYVGGVVWVALVGVPGLGAMRLGSALIFGDYPGAARAAAWVERVHPSRAWRFRATLQRGLVAIAAGDRLGGEATLTSLRHRFPQWVPLVDLERAALVGDHAGVLSAAPAVLRSGIQEISPFLRHLEALGEVGDIDALDREFRGFERGLRGDARSMARLILGVFHGEVDFVRHLLAGPCQSMPVDLGRFWLGTVYQASGERARAEEIFTALLGSGDPVVAHRAHRRLNQPIAIARPIPPELAQIVGFALLDEERFGDSDRTTGPVTRILLIIILGVFLIESLLGGASPLFQLGAFSVGTVLIDGEWWRLVTALFLHAGIAHVAFNALALHSLAPFVERTLGSARFLVVYFGSGIGGLTAITWATYTFGLDDRVVIGASGAIMGLVGATGAILGHAARTEGSPVARERLRAVGTIIGIQIIFDILVPQTSASAHLVGAALGYLLGRVVIR